MAAETESGPSQAQRTDVVPCGCFNNTEPRRSQTSLSQSNDLTLVRPHELRKTWPFGIKWGNARIRGPHEDVLLHCVSHRIHPQVVI